jgi:hypothetical protein
MRPYSVDIKIRFHLNSGNIDKDISSIIEALAVMKLDPDISQEVKLINHEYGIWYLNYVGDDTDAFVKEDLGEK